MTRAPENPRPTVCAPGAQEILFVTAANQNPHPLCVRKKYSLSLQRVRQVRKKYSLSLQRTAGKVATDRVLEDTPTVRQKYFLLNTYMQRIFTEMADEMYSSDVLEAFYGPIPYQHKYQLKGTKMLTPSDIRQTSIFHISKCFELSSYKVCLLKKNIPAQLSSDVFFFYLFIFFYLKMLY